MIGPLIYLLCVMAVVLVITSIPFIFAIIGLAIAAIAKWKAVKHIADKTTETLAGKPNLSDTTTDELVYELMKRGKVQKKEGKKK